VDGSHSWARERTPAAIRRDLVLASALGLDLTEVAPFVRSLRAVFKGPVILLVDHNPTLIAWLSTHDVESVVSRCSFWRRHEDRWTGFARVLQERPHFRNLLLADARQVVFQSDPFRDAPVELQFVEDIDQVVNAALVQDLVGEGLARRIVAAPSMLLDVVAGPGPAALRFCNEMRRLSAVARSGPAGWSGAENAVCTVVARLGLAAGDVSLNPQRVTIASNRHRVQDGLIVDPEGGVSPVVHGHARSPQLAAYVGDRWGVQVPNPKGVWTALAEAAARLFQFKNAVARSKPTVRPQTHRSRDEAVSVR
jgi:hypothetical protein